jgi:hypothetical protein
MKFIPILLLCALGAFAGDPKPLPNQAGNDDIDLQGNALVVPADIRQALGGSDIGPGYIAVRITVTPKSDKPLRIAPDDFTLLSRKNGERSPALSPHQIAGGGSVLVVRPAANQPRGDGIGINGPVWGGVTTRKQSPDKGGAPTVKSGEAEDSPLVAALTEKILPDKDIKTPTEGLLYFGMDGKLKPKDLSLIYEGPAGKLVIDFK